jgi:hypothetical protein
MSGCTDPSVARTRQAAHPEIATIPTAMASASFQVVVFTLELR